ncbi:MAG: asparagine synthase (glutamine-hydrolyzing) [Acidobacteria bacterium]|nr:asparagine synthase (glutamine-hydrolyzing) [Acidobacteriota bacterium]
MCGIAGFISKDAAETAGRERLLDAMCRVITHRGPDEQGTIVKDRAALGMRRLSIIDLKSGQQPIFDCSGNLAIVFNGEIYNYRDLKKDLEARGHKFKTHSDTETIVHAYEEFGADCVKFLRGMFAFAIYDFRDESLFIARDRVGKKPLFYSLMRNGDLVFGSELKSLLEFGIDREIDYAALDSYLTFGYVPEEFCIFKGVRKLLPGHFLKFQNGSVTTNQYWDFDYSGTDDAKTEAEYVELVRDKLREAVRIRLVSEVPLGAFLSGGVDSSSIVALMSEFSETPVKTFSIGFNEDTFSELKFARVAAKRFNTEHHEFIVTPDLVEVVDQLVWHFDEPFADSSALPTFMVSKMAREFVTVVLTGDGGDELFAGYTRYAIDKRRSGLEKLPASVRRSLLRPLSEALPAGAKGRNFLYNTSLDAVDRYIDSVSHFGKLKKPSLYSSSMRTNLDGRDGGAEAIFRDHASKPSSGDPTDRLLYLDGKTYLPSDILTKVDRMSMAASLEARAPLLDHELIELVQKIPAGLKLKGLETKYIFKKAMEGIVPDEILYREKQGFGVPINEWINAELKNRIREDLRARKTVERGYFEAKYIETLLDEHERGRRDHSHSLWILWMLELWHRRYVDKGT